MEGLLKESWNKGFGRPKSLSLREALIITCGYMRNNITEEVWAEIFGVSQSCISRHIKFLTPIICDATDELRPSAEEAAEATRGAIALVDGTLWPCWSWSGARDLWAGKYQTTGHGSLIITNYDGIITYVSDPVTGNHHDMAKLADSKSEEILKGKHSGPSADRFGHVGFALVGVTISPL
ncbi:MAG: helix-turn-helix domain-containing protein [Trebonia sp.]